MEKRKPGRPRSMPEDVASFSGYISRRAKNRLKAASQVFDTPAYQLFENAFWLYWESLPKADRDAAETIARVTESRHKAHKS